MPSISLDPPLIQIAGYWAWLEEEDAFRAMLRWLRGIGFYPVGEALCVKSNAGKLPRFQWLIGTSLESKRCANWTFDDFLCSREWLPVSLRLKRRKPHDTDVQLEYLRMEDASFVAKERHVVEISLSGALPSLLKNVPAGSLSANDEEVAAQVLASAEELYAGLCGQVAPTYASCQWERSLQPPSSLLELGTCRDFVDFFLSGQCVTFEYIDRMLPKADTVVLRRWQGGSRVQCGSDDDLPRETAIAIERIMKQILLPLQAARDI